MSTVVEVSGEKAFLARRSSILWATCEEQAGAYQELLSRSSWEKCSVTEESETSAFRPEFFGGIMAMWASGNGSSSAKI